MAHPWVKELAPNARNVQITLNVEHIKAFRNIERLEKATLNLVASQLKEQQIENLKDIFLQLDATQDGTLTMGELRKGISSLEPKLS